MGIPHFLVIPFPFLGHVNPLMQLSETLAKHGCKITFVNTEFSHKKFVTTGCEQDKLKILGIKFVTITIPDDLSEDERSDHMKGLHLIKRKMPTFLHKLIEDVNALDVDNKITCILVTMNMGWALQVGNKLGIKGAFLSTASATTIAACHCIPRLMQDGIIDSHGVPTKKKEIQLSPNMPRMDSTEMSWWGKLDKTFFTHIVEEMETLKLGEWWLFNSTCDLEPGALAISPRSLPIGPLMESDTNISSFWQEDTSCLDWLDQQPPQSVVYVSFGSLAIVEPNQFKELALGLDVLNMPFLWVVRPGSDNYEYPDEFHGNKGKIISWAPQRKILNHPAISCFISHCGWNSTIEGVCSGVPFLCWPFFTDQFVNRSYICNVWKVGVGLEKDENGLILKGEIKKKVEHLVSNEDIRARSLKWKKMTMNTIVEGGQSSKNLENFINWAM